METDLIFEIEKHCEDLKRRGLFNSESLKREEPYLFEKIKEKESDPLLCEGDSIELLSNEDMNIPLDIA